MLRFDWYQNLSVPVPSWLPWVVVRERVTSKRTTGTTIPRWKYGIPSDLPSQAPSGLVSTWMGDRLGTPGVVLAFYFFLQFFQILTTRYLVPFSNIEFYIKTYLGQTLYSLRKFGKKNRTSILRLTITPAHYLQVLAQGLTNCARWSQYFLLHCNKYHATLYVIITVDAVWGFFLLIQPLEIPLRVDCTCTKNVIAIVEIVSASN